MSNFKLNLPTDIPWERICVTEDMIDPIVCDERLPAKWQTSMAVFKYKPEEEYQMYPMYDLTYLKVTATITGYQPLDKEIQGRIDWDGVDVSTITGLTDLLNAYNPCHGAILQVVVGPHGRKPNIPLKDYPFFMDFEPKKRELYELATDTKEKSSRSIESLNITKSAGSTQSMEVLDIDMGSSVGFGSEFKYAGTGGGFNFSTSNQGQWGTKRLNADESMQSRSSDVGQEKRESFSFSTQLSQMYHLLDSYHLGTNRVVFFIQPRPHTLEEPSGFVRGPRPVDGIQEFFLVVAQPKGQNDFCVSLRLDTSHLTKTPIMIHAERSEFTPTVIAHAPLPTSADTQVDRQNLWDVSWDDVFYDKFVKNVVVQDFYTVPDGFNIRSIQPNGISQNGATRHIVSPDNRTVIVEATANSSVWLKDEDSQTLPCWFGDCPPEQIEPITGRAELTATVNLISQTPTVQIGEQDVLMITTRGLCCCGSEQAIKPMDEYVVSIKPIPSEMMTYRNPRGNQIAANPNIPPNIRNIVNDNHDLIGNCKECIDKNTAIQNPDPKYTLRQVNELSSWMKSETLKSLNDPTVKLQKFEDTEFFTKQLEYKLVQIKKGRELLGKSVAKDIPKEVLPKLEKYFGKDCKEITRRDMLSLRGEHLAQVTGMSKADIQKIKLNSLGVKFNAEKPKKGKKGDSTTQMEK